MYTIRRPMTSTTVEGAHARDFSRDGDWLARALRLAETEASDASFAHQQRQCVRELHPV